MSTARREKFVVDYSRPAVEQRIQEKAEAEQKAKAAKAQRGNDDAAPPPPPFEEVDLSNLATLAQEPQKWFWQDYMPAGHVTLLGGHGGAGKSVFGLMLAASIAAGERFLGKPTFRARVLFFSAEDPKQMVLQRLAKICKTLMLDADLVRERLRVLDATDADAPALFHETRPLGIRTGATTAAYQALREYVDANEVDVLIVDNASDVYDGDEINRAMVRAFVRSLARLVRKRGGAVLLLAHVDKATSRNGSASTNTESYSGSTAWHNSVRSRLFLLATGDKRFELQHQKSQFGLMQEPLALLWPEGGLLQPASASMPVGVPSRQPALDERDTRSLLALIHEYTGRGEFVSTSPAANGRSNVRVFKGQQSYPQRRKHDEVLDLLREAERTGLIARLAYVTPERKHAERWNVTPVGIEYLGSSAPSAPSVRRV